MKRTSYTRFLARAAVTLLVMLFAPTIMFGQNELTVYEDGTATNSYVPVHGLWADAYLKSEFVVPADELSAMEGSSISKMTFYLQTSAAVAWTGTFQVFLKEVDDATISAFSGTEGATVVYEGTLDATGATMAIEFSNSYTYNGGNLLVGVYQIVSGNYKSVAFYGETVTGASIQGYNSSSLDGVSPTQRNFIPKTTFEYTAGSGLTCGKPDELTANGAPTAYTFSFNIVGGSGLYNIETKPSIGTDPIIEDWTAYDEDVEETTITLTDLTPGKNYQVRVQSICTDITDPETGDAMLSGWKTLSFTTPEVCPDGKVCIGEGTATNSYLPSNNYYKHSLTQQIYTAEEIGSEGFILSIDLFKASTNEMVRDLDIYIVSTDKNEFESKSDWIPVTSADLVYSGIVTFADNDWTTIEFENPFEYNGDSNIAIIIDDNTGSYKSSTPFYAFTAEGNQALYYASDSNNPDPTAELSEGTLATVKNRIRLAIGEPPAVLKPTGLTVNYTGGLTAEISWTSEEPSFDIDVNGTTTENVTNPYILKDLELATNYVVKVRAKNTEGVSDWTNPVSFTTDICMPENQCVITLALTDSYGDGWNGAYIEVVDVATGASIGTFTNQNASKKAIEAKEKEAKEKESKAAEAKAKGTKAAETETYTFSVCKDREIQFVWHAGSYDSECSFVIYDVNEEEIVSGVPSVLPFSYTVDCTVVNARKPTDLAATEIGPRSAKLSWTENSLVPATEWVMAYKTDGDFTEESVTVNPFTFEGLTPETTYTVKVRPETGEDVEKWSDELTFTTAVAFPAPTAVAANNIKSTSAEISWEGNANSYNLRYMETEAPAMATIILNADNVWDDGTGYQMLLDADATAYGTIIPESGPLTASGDADASVYAEFEYKIPENADGSLTTTNMVCGASASIQIPAGTYDWCITNPTPSDKVWIASAGGSIGGRYDDFEFEAGKTYEFHVYNGGQNDATDLTITDSKAAPVKDGEWTVVENVTSPYTIEGLTPDTYYAVEVQAVYTGEYAGESKWASTSFTTLEEVPTPSALAASEVGAKTAVLSWTENGEATAWEICLNNDEDNLIAADSNPFTVTALTPETTYSAKVRSIVGEKKSSWSSPATFTTEIAWPAPTDLAVEPFGKSAEIAWAGDPTATSFNLQYRKFAGGETITESFDEGFGEWTTIDADGDGFTWAQSSVLMAGYPITTHSGDDMLSSQSYDSSAGALTPDNYLVSPQVTLGGSISFWACGQDASYAAEHFGVAVSTTGNTNAADFTTIQEWTLTAKSVGAKVNPGATRSGNRAQGTWYEFTADLSAYVGQQGYVAIRHFNCTDQFYINIDDITIEQPGESEEPWTLVENVTSPYTIEGLDPETKYQVQVQAVYADGVSKWAGTTFTTDIAFPAPTDLAADNITSTSAEISWTADPTATAFELQYAARPELTDVVELSYDGNDTYATSIGSSSAGTWTWGVLYTSDLLEGADVLNKVSIYETEDYNTGDITINVYVGGENPDEGELVYTQTVTPEANDAFHEILLDTPVTIDPDDDLWITLTETGTYVLTACETEEPNNQWVNDGGTWTTIGEAASSLAGYGWMIRAEVGTAGSTEWTTVENVTSPYELTGLNPETQYTVKVKAIYEGGESQWTSTKFITLEDNPVPFNINADLAADGATLTWDGNGESYQVAYMALGQKDIAFYDDFNNGLNQWTIYTEGESISGYPGWVSYNGAAASFSWYSNVIYNADNWLVTPQVDLKGTLEFNVYSNYAADQFEVMLSTTGNGIDDFTTTLRPMASSDVTGDFALVSIDLSSYAGQKGYIAIHHTGSDGYFLAIEDFGIYGDNDTENGEVQYMTVNEKEAVLSGLDTNKAYAYIIRSLKGEATSEWSDQGEFALLTLDNDATNNTSLLYNSMNMQAHVTLANRTLFKDNSWNTLCLPFDIDDLDESPLAGATVKTLDDATVEGTHIDMTFSDEYPFVGGLPYIVKWANGMSISNPAFANVTITAPNPIPLSYDTDNNGGNVKFIGYYDAFNITPADDDIYYIASDGTLKRTDRDRTLKALRAYFQFTGAASTVRDFTLNFGDSETTGIIEVDRQATTNDSWYGVNGVKFDQQPKRKGLYIRNGQKVVIK